MAVTTRLVQLLRLRPTLHSTSLIFTRHLAARSEPRASSTLLLVLSVTTVISQFRQSNRRTKYHHNSHPAPQTYYHMAITDLITARLDSAKRLAGSVAWGPFVQLSRSAILSVFRNVELGQLRISDTDGEEMMYGQQEGKFGGPRAHLIIHKETFWVRMLLFADMVGSQFHSSTGCAGASVDLWPGFRRELHAR